MMLASTEGSTNNRREESASKPFRIDDSFFGKISMWCKCDSSNAVHDTGPRYVEFDYFRQNDPRTLGAFAGVFSPVTLSMFSALIFLRMGYIVGNAGLFITLLQFGIAYFILVCTVCSICAISTNGAVEGGGAYFMISRTLGPEFGGSIGTLFFLANIVSSALCITGCVEGLVENFGPSGYLVKDLIPNGPWWHFLYCITLNTLNLLICLIGASMFAKTTVLILALVCACLAITFFSFFYQGFMEVAIPDSNTLIQNATTHVTRNYTGFETATFESNLWPQYSLDYTSHGEAVTFATVFGVLFSGVTGIMAGANMSGELKNASQSIPRGTLSAIVFTFVVYIMVSLLAAATSTKELMQNNYLFLAGVNVLPPSVAVGLLTATWSAALSNVIGGSRVLEALAKDNIFGPALAFIPKGTFNGNPLVAVFVSWVLVQLVLTIGSLNVIAQLNSVLFLLSYLATNLACLALDLTSAPNFRPSFKFFSWHSALAGLMGTIAMMFVINVIYAFCSILLCLVLVIGLHLFSPSKGVDWGSISQALIFHQVRKYLLLLDSRKNHVKFWRPQVLLMVNNPRTACPLIDFINDLKKSGLYILGHVITDEPKEIIDSSIETFDPALNQQTHWLNLIDHLKVKAFAELTVAPTVRDGFRHLIRLSGMGAMKPNTVVLGFHDPNKRSNVEVVSGDAYNIPDFLQLDGSHYYGTDFVGNDDVVFPVRNHMGGVRNRYIMEPLEYVQMMGDVLRLCKNLCICRNFHKLTKKQKNSNTNSTSTTAAETTSKRYIDVWCTNFLNPRESDSFDTTSLFMLQLACIVNMVPMWRKLKVRICICENGSPQSSTSSGSSRQKQEQMYIDRLKELLNSLRITAVIQPVVAWEHVVTGFGESNNNYLKSVNNIIMQQTAQTAVTFIYLPRPPKEDGMAGIYIRKLDIISKDLPPTIFVHGVNTVISTTL